MATDVEVSRALNALTTTFNDQKMTVLDVSRAQEIVTGSLGGEQHLVVHGGGLEGWVADRSGMRRATVRNVDGQWTARRPAVQGEAKVP